MKTNILLFLLLLTFSGCISVNKSILSSNPTGKVFSKAEVQVYFETDSIPSHTRIAIMTGKGSNDYTNESQMIDKLRKEAGKLGANAIILKGIKDPGAGQKFVSALLGTYSHRKGEAIAIYVLSLDMPNNTHNQPSDSENIQHTVSDKEYNSNVNSAKQPASSESKQIIKSTSTNTAYSTPPTRLPNLRRAVPRLSKYSDEQIINAYKKKFQELRNATADQVIKVIEAKYAKE